MKKPSIDAIRRFKEQQERKKAEEEARKVQDKLSILEHRAAQGDRKAKSELKIIEKAKEERTRRAETGEYDRRDNKLPNSSKHNGFINRRLPTAGVQANVKRKPKVAETDFEELMRLAAGNNNQIRKSEPKKPPSPLPERAPTIARKHRDNPTNPDCLRASSSQSLQIPPVASSNRTINRPQPLSQPKIQQPRTHKPQAVPIRQTPPSSSGQFNSKVIRRPPVILPIRRKEYYDEDDDYDDDDDEDDYEQDDFVVDEDDVGTQDEVSKTIRSVFGYDKRRCDLREAELDRQYRQIGRVSTFEDLEREERRASRLAAVEDARALREEEERKRMKKIRLKGR